MGHKPGTPLGSPDPPPCVPHSHGQAGEGAIADEQVAGREGGDAKFLHELLLAAQHPPHRHVLVLQHVQRHLQAQQPGGSGRDGGVTEPPAPRGTQQGYLAPHKALHSCKAVRKPTSEAAGRGLPCQRCPGIIWYRGRGLQEKWGINAAVPTSLPTKELLFSKISARYSSLFLWKKLRTSSALQEKRGWQRAPQHQLDALPACPKGARLSSPGSQ